MKKILNGNRKKGEKKAKDRNAEKVWLKNSYSYEIHQSFTKRERENPSFSSAAKSEEENIGDETRENGNGGCHWRRNFGREKLHCKGKRQRSVDVRISLLITYTDTDEYKVGENGGQRKLVVVKRRLEKLLLVEKKREKFENKREWERNHLQQEELTTKRKISVMGKEKEKNIAYLERKLTQKIIYPLRKVMFRH